MIWLRRRRLPEVICDTSALQYLYQLDMLWVLEILAKHIVIPPAVVEELAVGRNQGIPLPEHPARIFKEK